MSVIDVILNLGVGMVTPSILTNFRNVKKMSFQWSDPLVTLIWGWGIRIWGQKYPQITNSLASWALNEHFSTFLGFWPVSMHLNQELVLFWSSRTQFLPCLNAQSCWWALHTNFTKSRALDQAWNWKFCHFFKIFGHQFGLEFLWLLKRQF